MCICVYICIFNINTRGWGTRKRSQEREWNQVCDGFTCDILNQSDTWRNEKQLKRGVCQLGGCTDKWLKYQKGNSEKEKNTNKSQTQWMTFDDTEEGTEHWTKRGQKFRREKDRWKTQQILSVNISHFWIRAHYSHASHIKHFFKIIMVLPFKNVQQFLIFISS